MHMFMNFEGHIFVLNYIRLFFVQQQYELDLLNPARLKFDFHPYL